MKTFDKTFGLATTLILALSLPSVAQDAGSGTTRVVTFGDSLSDNGNLFIATGGVTPPSPPYNRRFTNELTFAEYLNGPMAGFFASPPYGPGNVNFAFGGARTDSLAVTPNSGIPGTADQINKYILTNGPLGADTLVTYLAGANNLFAAIAAAQANPANGQAIITAAAQQAAVDAGAQLSQLAAAGAQKILVYNLPNLGSTPGATAGGAAGIQAGAFSSFTFNAALNAAVGAAAAANPNTNFIQVDTNALVAATIANPGGFGFANVTAQCILTPACVTGTTAQQNQFLFWDSVHPTGAGHRLLATLTQMYLYASSLSAGEAALGEASYWNRHALMLDTLDKAFVANPRVGITDFTVSLFGQASQHRTAIAVAPGVAAPAASFNNRLDSAYGGIRLGAMRGIDANWAIFYSVNAEFGRAKGGFISADTASFGGDVAARWRQGPTFVTATLGGNVDVFAKYKRTTLIAPIVETASSIGGWSGSAAVEAGYDIAYGALTVTPVGRLAGISATVNGFSETGIAAVAFRERRLTTASAAAELRFRYALGEHSAFTALVGYEALLGKGSKSLQGQLVNNTAHAFTTQVAGLASPGFQYGAGLEGSFGAWTASVNYRGSFGSKQAQQRADVQLVTRW